ncbi:MAG: YraN family protein [Cyanobacteriota bacterium]
MPPTPTQLTGRWAEQRALGLLQGRGWLLVSRNWRCRWGELDLVLCKPGRLLLVEVKARSAGHRDGDGAAALRREKLRRLAKAFACWQAAHPQLAPRPVEFVAALVPLPPRRAPVRWVRLL